MFLPFGMNDSYGNSVVITSCDAHVAYAEKYTRRCSFFSHSGIIRVSVYLRSIDVDSSLFIPMPAQKALVKYSPTAIRDKTKVTRFGSRMGPKSRLLSNFAPSQVVLRQNDFSSRLLTRFPILAARLRRAPENQIRFTTSESAWQALKARNLTTFERFESTGDIGCSPTADSFLPLLPKSKRTPEVAKGKFNYWIGTFNAFGIVPKMATHDSPARRNALNLAPDDLDYSKEYLDAAIEKEVWMVILRAKARDNAEYVDSLVKHAGCQFVEFESKAKYNHENPKRSETYWSGMDEDGVIYGGNRMGCFLEELAQKLKDERV